MPDATPPFWPHANFGPCQVTNPMVMTHPFKPLTHWALVAQYGFIDLVWNVPVQVMACCFMAPSDHSSPPLLLTERRLEWTITVQPNFSKIPVDIYFQENLKMANHFAQVSMSYYNMTVWILAGNYISFTIAAGLIRLHMPGVKKSRV